MFRAAFVKMAFSAVYCSRAGHVENFRVSIPQNAFESQRARGVPVNDFTESDIYSVSPASPAQVPAEILISHQSEVLPAAGAVVPAARAATGPQLVKERRPVSDDDNQATAATVGMMCDYIAQGVNDDGCKSWAVCAVRQYGAGSTDPRMLFWGVFWLLKHCVKYVRDEPALFRMGEGDARDFLIAPAVLVRMAEPKEDCDGFTMLACTLLQILGIKSYIVTVKADPEKPSRWSHVFAVAELPGGACALDATEHGVFPGWMIPRQHIFDYQFWDLSGRPVKHALPLTSKMAGYVRTGRMGRRGMGDDITDLGDLGPGQAATEIPYTPSTTVYNSPAPASPGTNWTAVLSSIFSGAARVASVAEAPPGSVVSPSGAIYVPGANPLGASSIGSMLPILLIGGLVLFGISAASKK
jgi:hypothetical protein